MIQQQFTIEDLPEGPKFLSLCMSNPVSDSQILFYDIETTGSDRQASLVYEIGMVWFSESHWCGMQLLIEDPAEEPSLLSEFASILSSYPVTIQYYGSRFDQPFLEARYQAHGLANPFINHMAIDLYQTLKPFQKFWGLPNMKQTTLENMLKLPSREHPDGRKCLQIFEASMLQARSAFTEALIGHNREDLLGMVHLLPLLSILVLQQPESLFVLDVRLQEETLQWTVELPYALPFPGSCENAYAHIEAKKQSLFFVIPLNDMRIRQFYPNYKEYDYLPSEDRAVPKALSACLPKSHRKKATPETCYTWISVTEAFLTNFEQQDAYVRHNLPILLML